MCKYIRAYKATLYPFLSRNSENKINGINMKWFFLRISKVKIMQIEKYEFGKKLKTKKNSTLGCFEKRKTKIEQNEK